MAKVIAVTEAVKSLAEVEARFGLQRCHDATFFPEWRQDWPELAAREKAEVLTIWQRLLYHRSMGELLEGTVGLLVVSPLLGLAGFYDPPFLIRAEATVSLEVDDGDEILRGRIDVLVVRDDLWVMVVESKKTAISTRSALPQVLAYMMANPEKRPLFGVLTNGDDFILVKLVEQTYALSRVFSPYTMVEELEAVLQILRGLGQSS
jgi:hypothetical protein